MYADVQGDGASIGTVLVLEDEVLVSVMIEEYLLEMGAARVLACSSLADAARAAGENTVHCAILDVLVGGAESFGFADTLTERGIPFIFASAFRTEDIAERHRHRPLLAKPFSNQRLGEAIRGIVLGVLEDA